MQLLSFFTSFIDDTFPHAIFHGDFCGINLAATREEDTESLVSVVSVPEALRVAVAQLLAQLQIRSLEGNLHWWGNALPTLITLEEEA